MRTPFQVKCLNMIQTCTNYSIYQTRFLPLALHFSPVTELAIVHGSSRTIGINYLKLFLHPATLNQIPPLLYLLLTILYNIHCITDEEQRIR